MSDDEHATHRDLKDDRDLEVPDEQSVRGELKALRSELSDVRSRLRQVEDVQAIQNLNLMCGLEETAGLLYPGANP
jgi:hypothetical protein